MIISNHPDLEPVAAMFGVDFQCLSVDGKDPASKQRQEAMLEVRFLLPMATKVRMYVGTVCLRVSYHTLHRC